MGCILTCLNALYLSLVTFLVNFFTLWKYRVQNFRLHSRFFFVNASNSFFSSSFTWQQKPSKTHTIFKSFFASHLSLNILFLEIYTHFSLCSFIHMRCRHNLYIYIWILCGCVGWLNVYVFDDWAEDSFVFFSTLNEYKEWRSKALSQRQ